MYKSFFDIAKKSDYWEKNLLKILEKVVQIYHMIMKYLEAKEI